MTVNDFWESYPVTVIELHRQRLMIEAERACILVRIQNGDSLDDIFQEEPDEEMEKKWGDALW